jgi:sugar phosphate isomerase/epimerase
LAIFVHIFKTCFNTSHATVEDLIHLQADDVVYVHVNDAPTGLEIDEQVDNVRMLPGATSIIDITGFLQVLAQINYSGPVAAEPFNAAVKALPPAERVRATGESMRTIFQRADLSI